MRQVIDIPKDSPLTRVVAVLSALVCKHGVRVTIEELKRKRSDEQNRYLWGVVYKTLLDHLPGWEAEDVHEYMLGECYGWETIEGMGKKRLKPIRRSSKLNKMEFADYIAFIQRKASEIGVYIPDPNEQ